MPKEHEIVERLLGLATAGVPDPAAEFRLPTAASLAGPQVRWLWEGYMLQGKQVIVDAPGGSGKTRFTLGVGAGITTGVFPFGIEDRPVPVAPRNFIHISSEDDPEESAETFREIGGDVDHAHFITPTHKDPVVLDEDGCRRLASMITVNNVGVVVLDPLLQFLPGFVKSQIDNTGITRVMSMLNSVARETGATILSIRHFAKGKEGKEINQFGAGGEAFRNAARGQFVFFPHPLNVQRRNYHRVLIVSGRNTQRVMYQPFLEMVVDDGIQTWIHPSRVDVEPYVAENEPLRRFLGVAPSVQTGSRGPSAEAKQKAAQAILDYLMSHDRNGYSRDVLTALTAAGHNRATVYRARESLVASGHISDDRGRWRLTDDFDPFSDDAQTAPWWLE